MCCILTVFDTPLTTQTFQMCAKFRTIVGLRQAMSIEYISTFELKKNLFLKESILDMCALS